MDLEILRLLVSHANLTSKDILRMSAVNTGWHKALSCELDIIKAAAAVTGKAVDVLLEEWGGRGWYDIWTLFVVDDAHRFSQLMRAAFIDAPCFVGMWRALAQHYVGSSDKYSAPTGHPRAVNEPMGWVLVIP